MPNIYGSQEKKLIYCFRTGSAHGRKELQEVLGNKGVGLAEMSKLGIPVPPGFTISALATQKFNFSSGFLPRDFAKILRTSVSDLGSSLGLGFGDREKPLLLSIRSGASISMPGMMETILNLGLNDETVLGLASSSGEAFFAYDCYRRFIEMYSHVVLGIDKTVFSNIFKNYKLKHGGDNEENLRELIQIYYDLVQSHTGEKFCQNLDLQLERAVLAVFNSWNTDRAVKYRQIHSIKSRIGTAVNVQSMVFGNKGYKSATGVVFTRNPSTGQNKIFGEFLLNAQGEDVVAGLVTPRSINDAVGVKDHKPLELLMPQIYSELKAILHKLELYYRDMQDVEFTIEDNKLWILQTRSGKRTIDAAVKIAIDMFKEGLIGEDEVLKRIDPNLFDKILHTSIDSSTRKESIGKGLPASPGATSGRVVFSSECSQIIAAKHRVILVRNETSPDDIGGINSATGILTARGGMTSHAAVVARGMGKPCVTGVDGLCIDESAESMQINGIKIKKGEHITINGSTGEIFLGDVPTVESKVTDHFNELLNIAQKNGKISVRANAETVKDALTAKNFGASGIGLCRTEHMFFQKDRIKSFRKMVLSVTKEEKKSILNTLQKHQQKDFYNLFKTMLGMPVTIRLLDPPLHEFLPTIENSEIEYFAESMQTNVQNIKDRINVLTEVNPMLGHRGARLAITSPEIYSMQVEAILHATWKLKCEGTNIIPEIMIPLIMNVAELRYIKGIVKTAYEKFFKKINTRIDFLFGSMIELPSAVINISSVAQEVDFISFGTNDLTQTCLGISRDDSAKFLKQYTDKGIFTSDPFVSIEETVKILIQTAATKARVANPKIKIGVCGEHAGDPESIKFFLKEGLDYISCSPFRVPVAQVAAARFSLLEESITK